MQRQLIDGTGVHALELVGRHRVEDDLQPKVLLESLGLQQVAALAEGDSEQTVLRGEEQHRPGRCVPEVREVGAGDVGVEEARPPRWPRAPRCHE